MNNKELIILAENTELDMLFLKQVIFINPILKIFSITICFTYNFISLHLHYSIVNK